MTNYILQPFKTSRKSPMKKNLFSKVSLGVLLTLSVASSGHAQGKKPATPPPAVKKEVKKDEIGNQRREGIDVVQNRVFTKRGRSEFTLGMGSIFDNPFLRYQLAEARYTYHFREMLAFEANYAYAFHQNKALLTDLANIPCDVPPTLFDDTGAPIADCGVTLNPGPDPYKHIIGGNLVWAPIYGKFSIFSKKILHFDIFATAGAGYYMADRDNNFGFNVGVGTKVFVNDWAAVRVDFRNFTVKEGAPFNHIVNNRILSLGMSFFLPSMVEREQ